AGKDALGFAPNKTTKADGECRIGHCISPGFIIGGYGERSSRDLQYSVGGIDGVVGQGSVRIGQTWQDIISACCTGHRSSAVVRGLDLLPISDAAQNTGEGRIWLRINARSAVGRDNQYRAGDREGAVSNRYAVIGQAGFRIDQV